MMGFPEGKLKELLIACARAVEEDKESDRVGIDKMVAELRRMVSRSGDPFERLGAYMLEALVARLHSSGYSHYRDLKAEEAARTDLLSNMHYLYGICPQFKFGYISANGAIAEAVKGEDKIHIIDFNICDGDQWITLLHAFGGRTDGPPASVRITGISDIVSARSRDNKLELIEKLSQVAEQYSVPFEFHAVAVSGDQVEEGHLAVIPRPRGGVGGVQEEKEEVVVVNFTLELHHISNRDRILRLVKSLSPKVVTLVEQEFNTNTDDSASSFFHRFFETLDYYAAVFDSMEAWRPTGYWIKMNIQYNLLARDIVNLVACEGAERVERHELFVQWKDRLMTSGFTQTPLSSRVNTTIKSLLDVYQSNYLCEERDGVLYLGWKDKPLVVSSAWH